MESANPISSPMLQAAKVTHTRIVDLGSKFQMDPVEGNNSVSQGVHLMQEDSPVTKLSNLDSGAGCERVEDTSLMQVDGSHAA